jgi:4'-phosphopantetheinyl transferase
LDVPEEAVADLVSRLSPRERARAASYRGPDGRRRFAAGRAAVRAVLAAYLGVPAAELKVVEDPAGKPRLGLPPGAAAIEFGVSGSGDLALLAVAAGRPVGVDVERLRPVASAGRLAARYFAPEERRDLALVAGSEQESAAFLRCWTRKEAFVKARGEGLRRPLDSFAVTFLPGDAPGLRWCEGEPDAPDRWTFAQVDAGPGFVAVVATVGACCVATRDLIW